MQSYATRWQTQDLNPSCLVPESSLSTVLLLSRGRQALPLEMVFVFVWRTTSTFVIVPASSLGSLIGEHRAEFKSIK